MNKDLLSKIVFTIPIMLCIFKFIYDAYTLRGLGWAIIMGIVCMPFTLFCLGALYEKPKRK